MAATTITRATITDDSGAGTDGTILNSAWVGTAIYDKVDALFSTSNPVQFEKTVAGSYSAVIKNTSANAAAFAQWTVENDDSKGGGVYVTSSAFTPAGVNDASRVVVTGNGAGGVAVAASHASGPIKFFSGGTTERASLIASGHLVLQELTTNPGTSDLAADAAIAVYTKADKLVFAYNNGGAMTYITLDLDGSDTTLTHGTSAP